MHLLAVFWTVEYSSRKRHRSEWFPRSCVSD